MITTTVDRGEASGGNIPLGGTINADGDIIESLGRLSLEGSRITANTDAGDGANITIGAQQVVLDSDRCRDRLADRAPIARHRDGQRPIVAGQLSLSLRRPGF